MIPSNWQFQDSSFASHLQSKVALPAEPRFGMRKALLEDLQHGDIFPQDGPQKTGEAIFPGNTLKSRKKMGSDAHALKILAYNESHFGPVITIVGVGTDGDDTAAKLKKKDSCLNVNKGLRQENFPWRWGLTITFTKAVRNLLPFLRLKRSCKGSTVAMGRMNVSRPHRPHMNSTSNGAL